MKTLCLLLFALATGVLVVRADDEKFPLLKAGNNAYTNVTITSVTASDIYFIHAAGMANVKIKDLSPELQKHFHYNPAQARAAEEKLAENNVKYHEQLLHQPVVRPPDMTRGPEAAPVPAEAVWRTDYSGALKQAGDDHKLVLLDFTGSDWCPWCIKFEHDVLSTARFTDYARRNLELVKVDFPRHTTQPDDLKRANDDLAKRFNVDGFPTYVLVNADGRELGRQVGYQEGGPGAFITELEQFSKR